MHRLPAGLMLYRARMAASSSFFSPIPILLSLSRILRIFVSVLIITTMLSLAGDTIKQWLKSKKKSGAGYGFTAQTPWRLQKIRTFRIRERGLLPERAISFSGFSPGLNVSVYRKSSPMTSTHRM